VPSCGDAHAENLGIWRDAEGRLCWGVNDFDEAARLPAPADLVRMAASVRMARTEGQLSLRHAHACEAILTGYRATLSRGGHPFVLEVENRWLRRIVLGQAHDPVAFWKPLETAPDAVRVPRPAALLLRGVVPARADRGRIIRRRAGTGSLGRQRFVALTKLAGGPVAREVKAALPSAWAYASGTDRAPSISAAVLAESVRSADPVLSYGERWIVRRLSPESVRVTIDAMPKRRDEERLAWAMGAELANVHLGDPRAAAAAAADLDGRPERWLRDAARTMAKAVERDWKEWAAAGG
jgi:hypothetical protein